MFTGHLDSKVLSGDQACVSVLDTTAAVTVYPAAFSTPVFLKVLADWLLDGKSSTASHTGPLTLTESALIFFSTYELLLLQCGNENVDF